MFSRNPAVGGPIPGALLMSEIHSLSRNAFIREFRQGLDVRPESALGGELEARGYDLDALDSADGAEDGVLSGELGLGLLFDSANGPRGDRHKPRLSSRGDEGRLLRAAHASKVSGREAARIENGRLDAHVNGPVRPPTVDPTAGLSLEEIEALAYEHYLTGDVNKLVELFNASPGDTVGDVLKVLITNHGEPTMGRRGLGVLDPTMNALLHRIRSHGSIETQARAASKVMARIGNESLANPKTAKNYPLMVHATELMQRGEVAVRAHDYGAKEFEKAFSMMPNYIDAGHVPLIERTFDHVLASSVRIRAQRMVRGEDAVAEATRLGRLTGAAASGIDRLHRRSARAQGMLSHMFDVQLAAVSAMGGQGIKAVVDAPGKVLFAGANAMSPGINLNDASAPTTVAELQARTTALLDEAIAADAVGPIYHRANGTADLSMHPDLAILQTNSETFYEIGFQKASSEYLADREPTP